jgi:hypothetical protein
MKKLIADVLHSPMSPGCRRALHWEDAVTGLGRRSVRRTRAAGMAALMNVGTLFPPSPTRLPSGMTGGQIVGLDVDRGVAVRHADSCHG